MGVECGGRCYKEEERGGGYGRWRVRGEEERRKGNEVVGGWFFFQAENGIRGLVRSRELGAARWHVALPARLRKHSVSRFAAGARPPGTVMATCPSLSRSGPICPSLASRDCSALAVGSEGWLPSCSGRGWCTEPMPTWRLLRYVPPVRSLAHGTQW